jgi:hypothetical protein
MEKGYGGNLPGFLLTIAPVRDNAMTFVSSNSGVSYSYNFLVCDT